MGKNKLRPVDIFYTLAILAIAGYLITIRQSAGHINAKEINAERINIKDSSGKMFLALSSPARQALATVNGKPIDPDQKNRNVPGLIFFNSQGDEVGGLIYDGDDSSSYQLLTFDQHKNDQVMVLSKDETLTNGKWEKAYGLTIQERADTPGIVQMMADIKTMKAIKDADKRKAAMNTYFADSNHTAPGRMFLGRTLNGKVGMFLYDRKNRLRAKLYINNAGDPKLEFLDTAGKVVPLQ